jgi:hypothetical protein
MGPPPRMLRPPTSEEPMNATNQKFVRSVLVGLGVTIAAFAVPALLAYLWAFPVLRAYATCYWWAPFSAAYTIGSIAWTVRAERLLRRLVREQKVLGFTYDDMRRDVDDIEGFLENGNTLRQIPVIPLRKKCPR